MLIYFYNFYKKPKLWYSYQQICILKILSCNNFQSLDWLFFRTLTLKIDGRISKSFLKSLMRNKFILNSFFIIGIKLRRFDSDFFVFWNLCDRNIFKLWLTFLFHFYDCYDNKINIKTQFSFFVSNTKHIWMRIDLYLTQ